MTKTRKKAVPNPPIACGLVAEMPTIEDRNKKGNNTLSGFQVISGRALKVKTKNTTPYVAIRHKYLRFNKTIIDEYIHSDYISFRVNPEKKMMLIVASDANDPDAIRWAPDKYGAKLIQGKYIPQLIYTMMNWEEGDGYLAVGKKTELGDSIGLLFDLKLASIAFIAGSGICGRHQVNMAIQEAVEKVNDEHNAEILS